MRGRLSDIRAEGAELAIVGNGSRFFATAFRDEFDLSCPLFVDPDLRSYRAAGLRRGRVEILSPRLPLHALRAFSTGARQHGVQGDPWQLGGVFVIRPPGVVTYKHVSREAGDHAPIDEVIAALRSDTPAVKEETTGGGVVRFAASLLAPVVDPIVPLAFGAPGFRLRSLTFDASDLDVDMSARRVVITGATSGLGLEAALALADLGADIELVCRNEERAERTAGRIREETGNERVTIRLADLSDLPAVARAAREIGGRPVDVLIHNAGLLPATRFENAEGLELTFAAHVVGPFLLTKLLRPALAAADGARVVWVSSGGMYTRKLNLDDYNWNRRLPYDGVIAYAETKRAQVVLSELWAEELRPERVTVNAMHPGWADTPGVQTSLPRFQSLLRPILRTPAEGADTIVWLAVAEAARRFTGKFFFDRVPRSTHLLPGTRETDAERRKLWRLCETLTADFC